MLTATITYSSDLARFHRLEVEMSSLESTLLQERGMQVQFKLRDAQTDTAKIICKGLLDGYMPWSESPTALALRAMHALYTDWHENIPATLKERLVASMQIVIAYSCEGVENTVLTSISLTQDPGTRESYKVLRSIDASATWPLQIRSESAVPLGIALKLLAFENSSPIDFSAFPPTPHVTVHTDADRRRMIRLSDLPDYAVTAFRAYIAGKGTYRKDDTAVSVSRWQSFLRS